MQIMRSAETMALSVRAKATSLPFAIADACFNNESTELEMMEVCSRNPGARMPAMVSIERYVMPVVAHESGARNCLPDVEC